MVVRPIEQVDFDEWVRMRVLLWPDVTREECAADLDEYVADAGWAVFVCERPERGLCGFVELSTRVDYVEGCETSPVGYVEGWFVDADVRRQGVGRALFAAGEAWAIEKGFTEIGSDAELENGLSLKAHEGLGYEVVGRSVHFRKRLVIGN